ncbi:hypothetical protein MMC31_007257 [Peltigera leucophlebia]|nr:hypothetical protein [Peltigera leucophlebia]
MAPGSRARRTPRSSPRRSPRGNPPAAADPAGQPDELAGAQGPAERACTAASSVLFPTVVVNEDTPGKNDAYILEPHSALASPHPSLHLCVILFKARIPGTLRLLDFSGNSTPALSEADGYSFRATLPESFIDLEKLPRRVHSVGNADKSRLLVISEIV